MRRSAALSPTIFLRRNAGKTIPLIAVIVLAVLLVAAIIALVDSIPYSVRTTYEYAKVMVGITPRGDPTATPKLVEEVKKGSPVPIDRVVICRATSAEVRSIVGPWPYAVMAMERPDVEYYLKRQNVTRLTGRLPRKGQAEAIVSRPVAKNLNLHIYDPKESLEDQKKSMVQGPELSNAYSPYPVRVVGIVDTDGWLMVTDLDYVRANHFPPVDLALVFTKNLADQQKLDKWALEHFKGKRAQVFAYSKIKSDADEMFNTLFKILNVVIGLLVIIVTMMMGMLINIYQSQRLVEFGLLQALGYTKRSLLTRVLTETVLVIAGGWVLGLFASVGVLMLTQKLVMDPSSFALEVLDPKAYLYTVPVPFCILFVAAGTVIYKFRNFDPVGVVERRLV